VGYKEKNESLVQIRSDRWCATILLENGMKT